MKEECVVSKFIRYLQTYLVISLPFVIACIAWEIIQPNHKLYENSNIIIYGLREILGLNIMAWFAVLIVFLTMLVIMPSVREKMLRRLANLKERDEREEFITGKAARAAYISTLSLMIFFLFFSMFSFSIYRNQEIPGKHYAVGISVGFSPLNQTLIENTTSKEPMLFNSKNYSLSTSSVLLILLGWQLLVFNIAARREQD